MSGSYDVVILGSGTTAFAAAKTIAARGGRVLMVEQSHLGGTCVNWGCVPSKTLIHQAEVYFAARRGEAFGLNLAAAFPNCSLLMAEKRKAVETVRREHYQKELEANDRIEVLRGHGRFLSPQELQVGAEVVRCERFLIATGGIPRVARIPGLTDVDYLTSYSALHLACFPRSMIILGGGVIALEMGQMFRRFGTEVTILERGERLLKEFDPRLTQVFQKILEEEGMALRFGVETRRIYREGQESCLVVEVNGEEQVFRAERLMLAVGTAPASEGIGLELAGVEVNEGGFIITDEEMRTTAAGIWAAGDVTGPPLIAPAGAREAEVAAVNMLNPEAHRRITHRHTPMAVFVDPELATVGISPEQAREEGREVVETCFDLDLVAKAHVMGGRRGRMLLVAERGSGRLLGVQLLAPRAADIIHEATLAVRFGLTVYDLAETIHVYPSISDGLRLAALENIRQQALA
ncbi:MAG: dihydrolipoyl dehydrogenase family protein [Trichloromonadaceae bacterium]